MTIRWAIHVARPPAEVYAALDSTADRARFWAESAEERDGEIHFVFINGVTHRARVLARQPPEEWAIDYFGGRATFRLIPDGSGGSDVWLTHRVAAEDYAEVSAGWLNVLLPLKAWVQHRIDLRNHDPTRTWDHGFVDQ
jgi:uncharacterized protein YndB with AHSA1/START domain